MRVTQSQIMTVPRGVDDDLGEAYLTTVFIEDGQAMLQGFTLDQYELDAYTMWINEVLGRHAN